MQVLGIASHGWDGLDWPLGHSSLGNEYLLTDSHQLLPTNAAKVDHSASSFSNSLFSHGSPSSTLVGSSSGLQINLIWDSSVRNNANWSAIEAAFVAAAQDYTNTFSTHAVINIAVGYGEVGGSRMSSNALGESETNGYITNFATVMNDLNTADAGLVTNGLMSPDALTANSPPTSANFFVSSAEAKAIGLINAHSTAVDGYVGIGTSSSIFFPAKGGTIGSNQYDAVGVAAHELSEVMGRISLDDASLGSYTHVYTPLDLFRYTAPTVRDLTPTTGYFSTIDGAGGPTNLNTYNNPSNGGDAGDWASAGASNAVLNDAFDAFGTPGVMTNLSPTDLLEVAALGYNLASGLPKNPLVA